MFRWMVVSAALASTIAFAGDAAVAESNNTSLDKVATQEVGDIAATQVALFFATGVAKQEFDAPVLAQYDRGAKKLIVTIIGGRSTVEGARKSMDDFLRVFGPFAKNSLEKERGIRLTDSNTTLVYLVRSGYGESVQLKEVVRREGGKFITP
ncbi:hypothetical protein F0U62_20785 [Cystobacter fuscus]|uniref:hypothetical protein n=1 Tax=Cystobacter fuscus TaxID=43 RepID=UPI002B2C4950|nr:hypothetical protein F0U62_20785 [Cystobacter fuscus]